ncbi:MAG: hypothetical protein L0271_23410 [Gemmatimonadetes bacterium]|nr:hypothetical protein [Gemmatimonadota bacterium]
MTRRIALTLTLTAALTLLIPASFAGAQAPSFFLGAAPTLPTGEYGDYAKTGWLAAAGLTRTLEGRRIWLGAEGVYGQNSHDDVDGDKTNLYGANGLVGLDLHESQRPGPYLYASLGILVHKFSPATGEGESDGAFAYSGAAGYSIPLGGLGLWLEARYYKRKDTAFIPLMVGISVGGGGNATGN